jgi:hypothetical protein
MKRCSRCGEDKDDDELAGDPCSYCSYCAEGADCADHIDGRDGSAEDLTAACRRCNGSKGGKRLLLWLVERPQEVMATTINPS